MAYKIKNKPKKEKAKSVDYDSFEIKKGKILDYSGSWGSGISVMTIQRDDGKIVNVHCENSPTTRALSSAYGGIESGHTFNTDNVKGKEIYYSVESWGTMAGFMPVEEATEELEDKYLKQYKIKK